MLLLLLLLLHLLLPLSGLLMELVVGTVEVVEVPLETQLDCCLMVETVA